MPLGYLLLVLTCSIFSQGPSSAADFSEYSTAKFKSLAPFQLETDTIYQQTVPSKISCALLCRSHKNCSALNVTAYRNADGTDLVWCDLKSHQYTEDRWVVRSPGQSEYLMMGIYQFVENHMNILDYISVLFWAQLYLAKFSNVVKYSQASL